MDLTGQILFLLTAWVSLCGSEELKTLPDSSVFELKPPKEFVDLFKADDSKNLINPLKSPLTTAITNKNLPDVSKILPDPSIFEMKPPEKFLELFGKKAKEIASIDKQEKQTNPEVSEAVVKIAPESAVEKVAPLKGSPDVDHITKDTANPAPDTIKRLSDYKFPFDPSVFDMKPPQDFADLFKFQGNQVTTHSSSDEEESLINQNIFITKPQKENTLIHFNDNEGSKQLNHFPSWSFGMNDYGEQMKYPDWFHLPSFKPQDNKVDKHSESSQLQTPQNMHQSFSYSYFNQGPLGDQNVKPETAKSDDVNNQKLSDKISLYNKLSVPDSSNFVPVHVIANPLSHELGNTVVMSHRYPAQSYRLPVYDVQMPSRAYGFSYTNPLIYQNRPDQRIPEEKPEAPKVEESLSSTSAPVDNSDLQQTQSVKPNDILISAIKHNRDVESPGTQVAAVVLPSQNQPRSIISNNNLVFNHGDKLANVDQNIGNPVPNFNVPDKVEPNQENLDRPDTVNHGTVINPPNLSQSVNYPNQNGNIASQNNNYPQNQTPSYVNIPYNTNGVPNNYPQNQAPVYANVPYNTNGVPVTYLLANGRPYNGQAHQQIYSGQSVATSPSWVGGSNQNNLFALVPVANGSYNPNTYTNNNNLLSNGNGYPTGQLFTLVPANNNMLLTTKDEDDE